MYINNTQPGVSLSPNALVHTERVSRVDSEGKMVRQVGQDLGRLQERLEAERVARCGALPHLHDEGCLAQV